MPEAFGLGEGFAEGFFTLLTTIGSPAASDPAAPSFTLGDGGGFSLSFGGGDGGGGAAAPSGDGGGPAPE